MSKDTVRDDARILSKLDRDEKSEYLLRSGYRVEQPDGIHQAGEALFSRLAASLEPGERAVMEACRQEGERSSLLHITLTRGGRRGAPYSLAFTDAGQMASGGRTMPGVGTGELLRMIEDCVHEAKMLRRDAETYEKAGNARTYWIQHMSLHKANQAIVKATELAGRYLGRPENSVNAGLLCALERAAEGEVSVLEALES